MTTSDHEHNPTPGQRFLQECRHPTCKERAVWSITAAYEASGPRVVHPLVHTYPEPMEYACSDHLAHLLAQDFCTIGSTQGWMVRPVMRPMRPETDR